MGKKHYSGKELIYCRQIEKQKQQGRQNTIRQRMQNINVLKKFVEAARQDMRNREKEDKENAVSD